MTSVRSSQDIQEALQRACDRNAVILDGQFLCRSLGVLNPDPGSTIRSGSSLAAALELLREERSGALMVVDQDDRLVGILTERDMVRKVELGRTAALEGLVDTVMTRDPVGEPPDISIAYALTLMSSGGFRHLPVVDAERRPIGIFTVKDLIDAIVEGYTESLLKL